MPYGGPNIIVVGSQGGKTIFSTSSASQYSGVQLVEAWGCKWYMFSLIGGATTTTVTLYGTLDPAAVTVAQTYSGGIVANASYPAPGTTGGNWFQLDAPAQQSSPATVVNPLTAANGSQYFIFTGVTLRAVAATTSATQTGTSTLLAVAGY